MWIIDLNLALSSRFSLFPHFPKQQRHISCCHRDHCTAYALAVNAAHYLAQVEEVDETGSDPRTGKKQSATATRRQLRAAAYADYRQAANLLLQLGRFHEACGCLWSAKEYSAVAHLSALIQVFYLIEKSVPKPP